jgi:hypothetical protein
MSWADLVEACPCFPRGHDSVVACEGEEVSPGKGVSVEGGDGGNWDYYLVMRP